MLWFWFLVAPALALALLSLRGEGARARFVAERLAASPRRLPPASILVPVKGDDEGLRENLAALAAQDYPDFELIVAARTAADIPPGVLPSAVKVVLAPGSASAAASEKVENLLAAVRATRKPTEVLAFADSDGRAGAGWLRALAAALEEPGVGAATGYRWFAPRRASFWAMLRSAWNAVIAGGFGPGDNRFAWGGATAIRRDAFFELRVFERWKEAISDDYALSASVHAAGLRIAWAPGATVLCDDAIGPAALCEWTRRQLAITRCYAPPLWRLAFAAHLVYCAGMAAVAGAAAAGRPRLLWTLVPMLAPGMAKGWRRAALARSMLPGARVSAVAHTLFTPLATWMWLVSLIASAIGRTIRWRGRNYRLITPEWARKSG